MMSRTLAYLAVSILLAVGALAPAAAHSYRLGNISIGHFWAPPTAPGAKGAAVYGPLFNRGDGPATLVGARSPAASRVRFRIDRDGTISWPERVELVPGKPLAMAPWRVHLWLDGLSAPLTEGVRIPLTLDFGNAGHTTIDVVVETAGHD